MIDIFPPELVNDSEITPTEPVAEVDNSDGFLEFISRNGMLTEDESAEYAKLYDEMVQKAAKNTQERVLEGISREFDD